MMRANDPSKPVMYPKSAVENAPEKTGEEWGSW